MGERLGDCAPLHRAIPFTGEIAFFGGDRDHPDSVLDLLRPVNPRSPTARDRDTLIFRLDRASRSGPPAKALWTAGEGDFFTSPYPRFRDSVPYPARRGAESGILTLPPMQAAARFPPLRGSPICHRTLRRSHPPRRNPFRVPLRCFGRSARWPSRTSA